MSEVTMRHHGTVSESRGRVRTHYVERVRKETSPSMMEAFLAEYGLSTAAGGNASLLATAE